MVTTTKSVKKSAPKKSVAKKKPAKVLSKKLDSVMLEDVQKAFPNSCPHTHQAICEHLDELYMLMCDVVIDDVGWDAFDSHMTWATAGDLNVLEPLQEAVQTEVANIDSHENEE